MCELVYPHREAMSSQLSSLSILALHSSSLRAQRGNFGALIQLRKNRTTIANRLVALKSGDSGYCTDRATAEFLTLLELLSIRACGD